MSDYDDVWLVIPAYNEGQVIADVVEGAARRSPTSSCVDDGSTDESAEHVATTGAHLVRHPVNLGQGAALQTGLEYALRPARRRATSPPSTRTASTRREDVETMVAVLRSGEADVVLGSRFIEQTGQVPWIKRVVLRTAAARSARPRASSGSPTRTTACAC